VPASAGRITWADDVALPFPAQLESGALEEALGPLSETPFAAGVAETVARFSSREPDSENPTRRRS
jgi:hypothetical protein